MTSRTVALLLALLTAGCAGMFGSEWSSATPDCPPRPATASTPSPTLAAGGRGQPAREAISSDGSDFGSRPTGTSRLVATPMGTPVIVDSGCDR